MRDVPDLFRDGLEDWIRGVITGDVTDAGEAAGSLLAETFIRLRQGHEPRPKT